MEKAKRKQKPGPSGWWSNLFTPATIDFVAYLPLEECAARLQSREKTGFWSSTKTYVDLIFVEDNICGFQIKRTGNKYGTYISEGYLERWQGAYTHVSGEVRSNRMDYSALPIFLVVALGLLAHAIQDFDVAAVFAVFGLGVFSYLGICIMAERRHNLAGMIEDTLGY